MLQLVLLTIFRDLENPNRSTLINFVVYVLYGSTQQYWVQYAVVTGQNKLFRFDSITG